MCCRQTKRHKWPSLGRVELQHSTTNRDIGYACTIRYNPQHRTLLLFSPAIDAIYWLKATLLSSLSGGETRRGRACHLLDSNYFQNQRTKSYLRKTPLRYSCSYFMMSIKSLRCLKTGLSIPFASSNCFLKLDQSCHHLPFVGILWFSAWW